MADKAFLGFLNVILRNRMHLPDQSTAGEQLNSIPASLLLSKRHLNYTETKWNVRYGLKIAVQYFE